MEASALNSKVIQEDGAYSCFNIWGQGAEQIKTGGAAAGQSQTTGGLAAKDSMMAGGNHIKDSSVAMGDGLKADFKTATNTMTSGIDGIFKTGSAFLATTFNGLFTGIGMGGGSTYVGNLGATGAFGGTSISGGGGWVGTRSTGGTNNASLGQVSWGGTAASQAASSGYSSGGNFGSVKWFADGGVINKPQIVGVGEAGPEAIIPIGELPNMVQKMMGNTGGSDGHTHAIYMDGKKVADAVGPAIVKRMQQGAGLKVR
jgi:hypothetical protein